MKNILKDTVNINLTKLKSKPIIIHGKKDKVISIRLAKKMKRKTNGFLIKTNGGHFPQDNDPILISKVIESYANS